MAVRSCDLPSCTGPTYGTDDYCPDHQANYERTGNAEVRRLYSTTYRATLKRVARARGKATDYRCVGRRRGRRCWRKARHWAYVNQCQDAMVQDWNGKTVHYCAHIEHYEPKCVGCHLSDDEKFSDRN